MWFSTCTRIAQKQICCPFSESFYLLNASTICDLFLDNWMQCIDSFSLVLQRYVRKGNDAKNPAILRFFVVTERTHRTRSKSKNFDSIQNDFLRNTVCLFLENHSLGFHEICIGIIHTYIHTYIHTCTYVRTYVHTYFFIQFWVQFGINLHQRIFKSRKCTSSLIRSIDGNQTAGCCSNTNWLYFHRTSSGWLGNFSRSNCALGGQKDGEPLEILKRKTEEVNYPLQETE